MIENNVFWSYTDYEIFGDKINTSYKTMSPFLKEGIYNNYSRFIATPTIVVKRECFNKGIAFVKGVRFGQDSLLWFSLIKKYPILYIKENLSSVRIRGENAGYNAKIQMQAKINLYNRFCEIDPNYKKRLSCLYKFSILLCKIGCKLLGKSNNSFFSKLLYITPYLMFKFDYVIHKNKIIKGEYGV